MLRKKYNQIMEQPEEYRNKWALGLTISVTVLVFVSFSVYRGFISFGSSGAVAQKSEPQVAAVAAAPTPFENSKGAFQNTWGEIKKQYGAFTDSIANVLVPFIEGIEVYEKP